ITSTALKSVAGEFSGIAAGVNTTVSRLGGLLAIALAGLIVSRVFHAHASHGTPLARHEHDPVLRHASTPAFHGALILAAGLAFAAAIVAALGISDEEARARAE